MFDPINRRTAISLAVASACSLVATQELQAQQTPSAPQTETSASAPSQPAPPKGAQVVETVTITGYRASLAKAADLKREAIGVRDSIVAEDIGKFPEQNIADALGKLPGVEVIKDPISNEGQSIRLRGLGVNQTVTTLNGAHVRTTSTGKIGLGLREFSYDVFASELFSRADIFKTPLAELTEGGIGGVVDLQTPRPFDKKGVVARFSATASNNDNDGTTNPRGHFFVSNTWGNWGASVSVASSKAINGNAGALNATGQWVATDLNAVNNNRIVWNTTTSTGTGGLTLAQLNSGLLPRLIRVFGQESDRDRTGFNTSVQYKDSRWDVSWDTLYSKLNDDVKDNFVHWSVGDSTGAGRALVPIDVRLDANNNLQGVIGNFVQNTYSRTFLNESAFDYNALNAKFRVSDKLRLKGQLALSNDKAWRNDSLISGLGDTAPASRQTLTLNLSDPLKPLIQSDRSLLDPATLTSFTYSGGYRTETDKQKLGSLNAEYDYSFGKVDGMLKIGINLAESFKGVANYNSPNVLNNFLIPGLNKTYANATTAEKLAFIRAYLVRNDARASSQNASANYPSEWLVLDRSFIYGVLGALEQNKASPLVPNTSYDSTESITTFFAQSDFETQVLGRTLRANAGARFVQTKTDSNTVFLDKAGIWQPINRQASYEDVLPSASFAYDVAKNLVWRGAWGKTMTRGPIARIAGAIRIPNQALLGVEAGNPDLRPEFSNGFDTTLEWYPAKGSVAAVNFFERKIKGSAIATTTNVAFNTLGLDPALWQPVQRDLLIATPTTPIALTSFSNSPTAYKISGVEFAYSQSFTFLPSPFNGLGGTVSVTQINVSNRTKKIGAGTFELPTLPPQTIALTAFYERGPFSVRGSYTKRAAYANDGSNDMNGAGFQRWFNERSYVDATIGYKVSKNFELRFDALNIMKTKTFEYFKNYDPSRAGLYGNDESRTENGFQAGRTLQLTLRGTF